MIDRPPAEHSSPLPAAEVVGRTAEIVALWREARPDLDLAGFLIGMQIARIGQLTRKAADITATQFGLGPGEMTALTTLRWQPPPHALRPTDLFRLTGVTSGAMTYRIDKLVGRGLVVRLPDPDDRRGAMVRLTPPGVALADRVVEAAAAAWDTYMASLLGEPSRLDRLNAFLADLAAQLEGVDWRRGWATPAPTLSPPP